MDESQISAITGKLDGELRRSFLESVSDRESLQRAEELIASPDNDSIENSSDEPDSTPTKKTVQDDQLGPRPAPNITIRQKLIREN